MRDSSFVATRGHYRSTPSGWRGAQCSLKNLFFFLASFFQIVCVRACDCVCVIFAAANHKKAIQPLWELSCCSSVLWYEMTLWSDLGWLVQYQMRMSLCKMYLFYFQSWLKTEVMGEVLLLGLKTNNKLRKK